MDFNNNNNNSVNNLQQNQCHFIPAHNQNNFDVILVSDDGQVQRCHQTLLSLWSPYFERTFYNLSNNIFLPPGQVFVIVLPGVAYRDLQCVVNYIYNGSIDQFDVNERFTSLMKLAKEWEVKGLIEVLLQKLKKKLLPPPPGYSIPLQQSLLPNSKVTRPLWYAQPLLPYNRPFASTQSLISHNQTPIPHEPIQEPIALVSSKKSLPNNDNMEDLMKQFDSLLNSGDSDLNCTKSEEIWSPSRISNNEELNDTESNVSFRTFNNDVEPSLCSSNDQYELLDAQPNRYRSASVLEISPTTSTPSKHSQEWSLIDFQPNDEQKQFVARRLFRTQSANNIPTPVSYADIAKNFAAEVGVNTTANELQALEINRLRKKYQMTKNQVLKNMVEKGVNIETRNPKALLHDILREALKFTFKTNSKFGAKKVECIANLEGYEFKGTGPTEAEAKNAVALKLLEILFDLKYKNGKFIIPGTKVIPRLFPVTVKNVHEYNLGDIFERLVLAKYAEVVKSPNRFKSLAGIIMTVDDQISTATVIAVGTAGICGIDWNLRHDGDIVINSHAEVIVRRALIRCFYTELIGHRTGHSANLFTASNRGKYQLKSNIKFHLYVNSLPCGVGHQLSLVDDKVKGAIQINHVSS